MGLEMVNLLGGGTQGNVPVDPEVGGIQMNTNMALPASYNFKEFVYPEPNDQTTCQGITNSTATIEGIYLAQTHRREIDHPLFFTIGHRPAVLQLAVTGTGAAPDVKVTGTIDGQTLGQMCLAGPTLLSSTIDLSTANFQDYFSVTLPKSWIVNGLQLTVEAGSACRVLTPEELKIGPFTEVNLVEVKIDILDYNNTPVRQNQMEDFLEEIASAIPASVVRYGAFPEVVSFPEYVVSDGTEQLLRLTSIEDFGDLGFNDEAALNSVANLFAESLQEACGD